jgi:gluconolactonase
MRRVLAAGALLALGAPGAGAQVTTDVPTALPAAIVDLRTGEGARLVGAAWRYSDVSVVEVEHREPGPDLRPSGAPNRTNDITPHAGASEFDDSTWPVIAPAALETRRSHGRLAFNWYRTSVTLPARLGGFDVTGSTVVFELVIDDYAEIWVDGKLPVVLGQTGGQLVKGFNAPNRVLLTTDARPGQRFQLAIFGVNGPLSNPPINFIWIRSATLDFYRKGQVGGAADGGGSIVRLDPAVDRIIPRDARLEKLAGGFRFTEGPVWHPDGYLLFSDPNANTIYRWSREGSVSVYRSKSGYAGIDVGEYRQPGSNGLPRPERAAHHQRAREPPRGAAGAAGEPHSAGRPVRRQAAQQSQRPGLQVRRRALLHRPAVRPAQGVRRSPEGAPLQWRVHAAGREAHPAHQGADRPNGLAFSPDEKYLYVDNWDLARKVLLRYEMNPDGTISNGKVFYDFTSEPEEVALDGIKVDQQGNVYVSAPRGVWILSPEGKALGRIEPPEHDANFAWGDEDGRGLYLAASTGLYRIRLSVPGVRPAAAVRSASR